MTFLELHNALRILTSIDQCELEDAGITSVAEWGKFRTDPFRYFIRTDDERAEKIYSIMERRAR